MLACAMGAIRFGLPATGGSVMLGPGDRLDLPAGTRHDAVVGPDGVRCLVRTSGSWWNSRPAHTPSTSSRSGCYAWRRLSLLG